MSSSEQDRIRELEEENARLKKELKDIKEEFKEHKQECALVNKGTPAFVKQDVTHKVRLALGAPQGHKGYWRKIPERIDFMSEYCVV